MSAIYVVAGVLVCLLALDQNRRERSAAALVLFAAGLCLLVLAFPDLRPVGVHEATRDALQTMRQ